MLPLARPFDKEGSERRFSGEDAGGIGEAKHMLWILGGSAHELGCSVVYQSYIPTEETSVVAVDSTN